MRLPRTHALALGILLAFAFSEPAEAQSAIITNVAGCAFGTGQVTAACVPAFLAHIIRFVFSLTGAFAVIMIVISGYQIALAKALGRDRSEGFTRLRVAIIGFILSACSWFIVDFIIQSLAFGVSN